MGSRTKRPGLVEMGLCVLLGLAVAAFVSADETPLADGSGTTSVAPPERMMSVTLECPDGGVIKVAPMLSLGVDVVNTTGMGKLGQEPGNRLSFACLPDAVAYLMVGYGDASPTGGAKPAETGKSPREVDAPLFLVLRRGDDGKTLKLRIDGPFVYVNDSPASLYFDVPKAREQDKKGAAARTLKSQIRDAVKRLEELKNTQAAWEHFGVAIGMDEECLPILEVLKATGAGVYINGSSAVVKTPESVKDTLFRAVVEVNPHQLMIEGADLARLKGDLSFVETLYLGVDIHGVPSDISRFRNLRHLAFVGDKGAIDLARVECLTQLRAIGSYGDKCRNADRIGQLRELRYLSLISDDDAPLENMSILGNLPHLKYLAIKPAGDDVSFVEKMPELQTLCIPISEQQDLKPLAKLASLRCLAVCGSEADVKKALAQKNVSEFQESRSDVKIVPYQGICLGSLWLVPLAAGAAAAAWWIRRRRRAAP